MRGVAIFVASRRPQVPRGLSRGRRQTICTLQARCATLYPITGTDKRVRRENVCDRRCTRQDFQGFGETSFDATRLSASNGVEDDAKLGGATIPARNKPTSRSHSAVVARLTISGRTRFSGRPEESARGTSINTAACRSFMVEMVRTALPSRSSFTSRHWAVPT